MNGNLFKKLVLGAGLLVVLFGATGLFAQDTKKEKIILRISYFRPSIPATVQKSLGSLEQKLAPLGVTVQWNEFKATTDSVLALSSGDIDLSVSGIEGQLAAISTGVPLQIVATGPHQNPKTGWYTAILVPQDSKIQGLADLKGKKIAVGRGGFSETVLAVAVQKGGARYPQDVQPVYVSTADGVSAFTTGQVDALLTLDPYIPFAQKVAKARILTTNEALGYPTIWSVSVTRKFAEKNPEVVKVIAQEFQSVGPWIATHQSEATTALAKVMGFDMDLWKITLSRASYVLAAPNSETLPDLQYVSDQLLALGVIRKPVKVADHLWKPAGN